jgi:hypothetical protein
MLGHGDMLVEAAAIEKARRNETMTKLRKVFMTSLLAAAAVGTAMASDRKDFAERYKDKYFVVMRDGLALAIYAEEPPHRFYLHVRVSESSVDTSPHGFVEHNISSSQYAPTPEALHRGEVLRSIKAAVQGEWLLIWVESLSPHAITRGVGAFEHESHELPKATLMFPMDAGYEQAKALIDQWLKTFDTQEAAAKFGNTASGAFVKEVKLGMTPAEVEAAMGLPEAKVDLGEKMLYKYKNMTVEFHDGKVTDVR